MDNGEKQLAGALDQDIRNKIILILLVAIIFILSLGIIIWVLSTNSEANDISAVSPFIKKVETRYS